MSTAVATYDDMILSGLNGTLKPEAAESLLSLSFSVGQQQRMSELARKARAGELSENEREEAESFERVSSLLGIVHSQARMSLKNAQA